jgi:hypothetical protein
VPLATTRRFLAAHRELVANLASIYRDSIRLFKNQPQMALEVIGRHLPALASQPQVLEKCYRVFAELFEPTLTVSASSLDAILDEVALQDPKAKDLDRASLVENLLPATQWEFNR